MSISALSDTVPIGRPIAGTPVYVFDARLRPVPIGTYPEIVIGGDAVWQRYLDDTALTHSRCIVQPLGIPASTKDRSRADLMVVLKARKKGRGDGDR